MVELIKKKIQEQILAMVIIKRADKRRFGNLQIELKNSFLLGKDEYPKSVPEVLKILNNYKPVWTSPNGRSTDSNVNSRSGNPPNNNGVTFLQTQGATTNIEFLRGSNGSFFANVTCRLCGLKGHYQSHCPVVADANGHRLRRTGDGNGGTPQTDGPSGTLTTTGTVTVRGQR